MTVVDEVHVTKILETIVKAFEHHIEPIDGGKWWVIRGRECAITIEPRPVYCDRGAFVAKLFTVGKLAHQIDHQDGWPRYYFHMVCLLKEIEAWLKKREQWVEDPKTQAAPLSAFGIMSV